MIQYTLTVCPYFGGGLVVLRCGCGCGAIVASFVFGNPNPRLVVAVVYIAPLEGFFHFVVVVGATEQVLIALVFLESGLWSAFCLLGSCYRLTCCCVGAILLLQVAGAHPLVMSWWMVLCEVVCEVFTSFLPANFELALCHAVADPIKAHVDGF